MKLAELLEGGPMIAAVSVSFLAVSLVVLEVHTTCAERVDRVSDMAQLCLRLTQAPENVCAINNAGDRSEYRCCARIWACEASPAARLRAPTWTEPARFRIALAHRRKQINITPRFYSLPGYHHSYTRAAREKRCVTQMCVSNHGVICDVHNTMLDQH